MTPESAAVSRAGLRMTLAWGGGRGAAGAHLAHEVVLGEGVLVHHVKEDVGSGRGPGNLGISTCDLDDQVL